MYGYGSDDWPALPPMSALEGCVHVADIFDLCAAVPDASVDMILCDLPYGTTACSWDTVIPFESMWAAFRRIAKPRAAIVLTASQPFTSALVMSWLDGFKYSMVWEKQRPTGFFQVKNKPLNAHEDILIFFSKHGNYYPQGLTSIKPVNNGRKNKRGSIHDGGKPKSHSMQTIGNFPRSVIRYNVEHDTEHPTQKPVALFEYLIRTYTQSGELVFDPCVGSGTTAVAARNTGRRFIVGDQSPEYAAIAERRIAQPFTPNMFDALEQSA